MSWFFGSSQEPVVESVANDEEKFVVALPLNCPPIFEVNDENITKVSLPQEALSGTRIVIVSLASNIEVKTEQEGRCRWQVFKGSFYEFIKGEKWYMLNSGLA